MRGFDPAWVQIHHDWQWLAVMCRWFAEDGRRRYTAITFPDQQQWH